MIGQTISHYRITEKLGEGGMGVVYKAEDTKLERTVALKFLAAHLLNDEEARARFLREAKAAAALDHPNICTVYEIDETEGQTFLAMAYLAGHTVKDKIAERPLKLDEVLDVAVQTAQGLQAAHEKDIVHRDIKSANLMVTPQGQVKIMDFGLAQLADRSKLTATTTILGTPSYMSPEQAVGDKTDRRTDLWSLGVVLYEMVAGRLPFGGERQEAVLYGISNEEPEPVTAVRAGLPMELEWIVEKCLTKPREERYQHVEDLLVDLRSLQRKLSAGKATVASGGVGATPFGRKTISEQGLAKLRSSRRTLGIAVGACALAALTLGFLYFSQTPSRLPSLKTSILAPEGTSFFGLLGPAALSPDGRWIAFAAVSDNQPRLWIRDLDSLQARLIPASEAARFPFWSPDSRSVGFFTGSDLKRVEAAGGPVRTVAAGVVVNANGRGASWSREDLILFSPFAVAPLSAVPAAGGPVEQVTTLNQSAGESSHRWPFFLPDGRHYLYTSLTSNRGESGTYWAELGSDNRRRVSTAVSNVAYASGHLLFMTEQILMAQRLNPTTGETSGEPFPVAEGVLFTALNLLGAFSVSEEGLLLYAAGGADPPLTWYDRGGSTLGTVGPPSSVHSVAISPDGTQVAVSRSDGQQEDLWLHELAQGTESRFTFDYGFDILPLWSPDGEQIIFGSNRTGRYGLYQRAASGRGEVQALLPSGDNQIATDWSRDGRYVVFQRTNPDQNYDLWILPLTGATGTAETGEPFLFLQTSANEGWGKFSPDGHWLAYTSDETGRNEVFVQSFPDAGSKFQVSEGGGNAPVWRRDGKELFYESAEGKMTAVTVEAGADRFVAGTRQALFEARLDGTQFYDVTADGQRFLVPSLPGSIRASSLTLVVNGLP
jgi:serine/threonine protein kinase